MLRIRRVCFAVSGRVYRIRTPRAPLHRWPSPGQGVSRVIASGNGGKLSSDRSKDMKMYDMMLVRFSVSSRHGVHMFDR